MKTLVDQSETAANPIVVRGSLSVFESNSQLRPHAFRIFQEALTNARRHGAPGTIEVSVTQALDLAKLQVVNPVHTAARVVPGHGLHGIAERVALCRGEVTYRISGDRFQLLIDLPTRMTAAILT